MEEVGEIYFPVCGETVKVWKDETENGHIPILVRNIEDNELVLQTEMSSSSTDQEIIDKVTEHLNEKGWY